LRAKRKNETEETNWPEGKRKEGNQGGREIKLGLIISGPEGKKDSG